MKREEAIKKIETAVIKVGTRVITNSDGTLDLAQIESLAVQISKLKEKKINIVLVTSGAIGAGMAEMGLKKRPSVISELQACAAVGQGRLIETYSHVFKKKGYIVAQVLLTADDLRSRERFLNARNTMLMLLEEGIIPIVNENDTVAVSEIKFGDNDRLSALVCNLIHADILIILSNVSGLHDKKGDTIEAVSKVNKEIEDLCTGKGSHLSTGGMKTKLEAAKIVMRAGESVIIADGRKQDILLDIFNNKNVGTFFEPHIEKLTSKERWLAFCARTHGGIIVDKGAEDALVQKGKSLLASGIIGIKGNFKTGDVVNIINKDGKKIACGLVNYNSEDVDKIKKLKTSEIFNVLGCKTSDEIIHRNNMSVF